VENNAVHPALVPVPDNTPASPNGAFASGIGNLEIARNRKSDKPVSQVLSLNENEDDEWDDNSRQSPANE
jgi:hypothetical protein